MRRISYAFALLLGATGAWAETIRVEVWYPAASDNAAALRSIQVEPFGGNAGDDLTIQAEDALRAVNLGDGPYFRVIPAVTGSGGEALLRGTADTEQRSSDFTEQHERCVKDAKGECTTAKEKITVKCRRRTVELVVQLRLIARDGTLLWSDNRPETHQDSYCEDADDAPRPRSGIARELAGKVALRVRNDFAPRRGSEDVRVDEGRKGLSKSDADNFKAAVRQVKDRQVPAACATWAALGETNPDHAPTQYNLGLCHEAGGNDAAAAAQYRRVLAGHARHGLAQRGMARIADRDRVRRQLEAHAAD